MVESQGLPYVLIVDDTPENLFSLGKILENFDVSVVKANSGNEALAATLYHDFSMILLDINMPDMDGYEVAELLKKEDRTAHIPIIFLTAMDQSDANIIKGYDKGAVDYIIKPINIIILSYKIKVLLELFLMKRSIDIIVSKKRTQKSKVLIVDDNPENLLALELILKNLDIDIIKANSGNEALSAVLYNDFALIILDVQMPEMDGFEVADILKSDIKTEVIPIIFLTAIDRDETKEVKGYDKGAVDFIFKPFNAYILLSKVKVFLELNIMKSGLESLADERYHMLVESNEKLRKEILNHKKTAKELVKAKTYLGSIFDSISLVLIALDSNGIITEMNREAEKTSNLSSEQAIGHSIKDIFPFYSIFINDIQKAINLNETIKKTRVFIYIDGKSSTVNFTAYPLNVSDEIGAVLKIEDISEKIQMNEMMIQSEKMLTLGGLAAGMAHEIKDPLTGIMQTAQVLLNRLGEDMENDVNINAAIEAGTSIDVIQKYNKIRGVFKMLDNIRTSGIRAKDIVLNMLNFARKENSKLLNINIKNLIINTISLAKNDFASKKYFNFSDIKIIQDFEENLPLVRCEGPKIQQVILNILKNGTEAMQDDKTEAPNFIIKVYVKEERSLIISISDNGPGMDKDTCNHIFEPFFTTKDEGIGTGLGMSVSHFIITQNHGGKLSVESTLGYGAKFIIILPLDLTE